MPVKKKWPNPQFNKNRDNASDKARKAANKKTKVRMANYRERKSARPAEKMTTRWHSGT